MTEQPQGSPGEPAGAGRVRRWSAVLPTTEIGADAGAVRAWAEGVEEMGFDRIVAYDHVLGAVHADREPKLWGPYTERDPFREPLVLFGFLAAVTSEVELMTGVLVLPQRQAALVAKQGAEVDLLSGGRFVLGVGTGWNYVEYESLGLPFTNRAKRMDEQIEVIRRLWSEPVVDLTGTHHRIDRAGIAPLPARRIPIWFGGSAPASLRRAAAVGDGYLFGTAGPRVDTALGLLRDELAAAGREVDAYPAEAILHAGKGVDAVAGEAASFLGGGGNGLAVSTMTSAMLGATSRPCASVDDHLALLAEVRAAVRP